MLRICKLSFLHQWFSTMSWKSSFATFKKRLLLKISFFSPVLRNRCWNWICLCCNSDWHLPLSFTPVTTAIVASFRRSNRRWTTRKWRQTAHQMSRGNFLLCQMGSDQPNGSEQIHSHANQMWIDHLLFSNDLLCGMWTVLPNDSSRIRLLAILKDSKSIVFNRMSLQKQLEVYWLRIVVVLCCNVDYNEGVELFRHGKVV